MGELNLVLKISTNAQIHRTRVRMIKVMMIVLHIKDLVILG